MSRFMHSYFYTFCQTLPSICYSINDLMESDEMSLTLNKDIVLNLCLKKKKFILALIASGLHIHKFFVLFCFLKFQLVS